MSNTKPLGMHMQREMAEQPTVLAGLIARWDEDVERIARVLPDPLRGVAFVGRGSSDNAAMIGRYAVELFAGVPATLAAPSLSTRYEPHLSYEDHLIVALSQSGGTPEIISAGLALRGVGSRLLGITNTTTSDLAGVADLAILLSAGDERAVPATKTVTAEVLAVLAIASAIAVSRERSAPVTAAQLAGLPAAIEMVLADDAPVRALVDRWRDANRLQVVGRGLDYGAVLEVALKIKETTGVFAQGISAADFVHGPIAAVDAAVPVVVIDVGGPNSEELAGVVARLVTLGVDVATIGTAASSTLGIPDDLPEVLSAVAVIVRGQQLALEWARKLGRDPDHPAGLSKMTLTY